MLARAASEVPGVLLSRRLKTFLREFGESAISYEIKFWLDDESRYNDIMDGIRTQCLVRGPAGKASAFPSPSARSRSSGLGGKRSDAKAAAEQGARRKPILKLLGRIADVAAAAGGKLERFGRGEHVIEQGDAGESMFILLERRGAT